MPKPPNSAEAHNSLAIEYFSKGELDKAIEQYQTALGLKRIVAEFQTAVWLKPDYAVAHNNLGTVYRSQGQLDRAAAEYQTAVRLKPDYAEAHYNLGIAYASRGQLEMAVAELQTALRLKPAFMQLASFSTILTQDGTKRHSRTFVRETVKQFRSPIT